MISDRDKFYLNLALKEAVKAKFYTHPNPKVGCLIVKNEKIISKGYHKFFGGPHAEVNAVKNAKESIKDSTMYVTLEPCSTYGKTPPCTELIIKSGIKRVVIGMIDPNPLHRGKGVEILKKHGIEVDVADGEISEKCRMINEVFIKNMSLSFPYVSLKLAVSIDGKIADEKGNSKWISCEKSRRYVHYLRAFSDCILVGSKTVIRDNPKLTIRGIRIKKQPDVCIIDLKGKISYNFEVFNAERRVFIVSNAQKAYHPNVFFIKPKLKGEYLDLKWLCENLYSYGIRHIFVEGGGYTITNFINQDLYDRILLFISPTIIGKGSEWFSQKILNKNSSVGLKLELKSIKRIDEDIFVELRRCLQV